MYAALMPHLKKGAKETDILEFEFEKKTIQKVTEEDIAIMNAEIQEVKDFWAMHDAKKNKC